MLIMLCSHIKLSDIFIIPQVCMSEFPDVQNKKSKY